MTTEEIRTVSVVGAGRMGHGIALSFALADRSVRLTDADDAVLDSSHERIADALDTLVAGGRVTDERASAALENVTLVRDVESAVADADFVTEAVAEDLAIKRSVFADLDQYAPADALLATNTSGLSIDDIATPVEDAGRVLGTHWFNPPYLVPLVEIVTGPATDEDVVQPVEKLLEEAEKTPVVVRKDIPGFIGNRIQAAMSYEAFSLLARGVATPEDIDKAVKAGFGFRLPMLGIFEKIDQSGLEIHHAVEDRLMDDLDRGTDPNPVVEELVAEGHTGADDGVGVYDWTDVDLEEAHRERDQALLSLLEVYESADAQSSPPANYDRT